MSKGRTSSAGAKKVAAKKPVASKVKPVVKKAAIKKTVKKPTAAKSKAKVTPAKKFSKKAPVAPKKNVTDKVNKKTLELCLILDCTGSMGSWIERSKDTLS